ncbi:formimidoylglutamase [Pedobacter boryungensis]|uniref:Formimidoylglutamase n=1 Tax=Pedobacter boryungensis TaxID=869962 RepID=A0ABX2DBS1_9SPHI|nr:formimidoylglutamase [Pedobacter boryungensis]NQX31465.1 formimidoylglutamase [Pedobacter boryungensis]
MDSFKFYSQSDVLSLVNQRIGEIKLGERVQTVSSLNKLESSSSKFVIFGIPEDIGVRANYGIGGAKTGWTSALKAFLNTQSNSFLSGEEILVLGHFEIDEPTDQTIAGLRNRVNDIDVLVCPIVEKVVAAGKIPIVIGGGHNNAFPIIWGTSLGLKQPIDVVNIDAHADLRNTAEGRHSGNGFSFALQNGFLNQYRVFGLHQNYVNHALPNYIKNNVAIKIAYFEDLLQNNKTIPQNWQEFTIDLSSPCGLEIDLDSIENVLSSAISPSGFALNDIRKILLGNSKKFSYLHICEGATTLADGREDLKIGKTIAYLITDFIKALLPRIYPQL